MEAVDRTSSLILQGAVVDEGGGSAVGSSKMGNTRPETGAREVSNITNARNFITSFVPLSTG